MYVSLYQAEVVLNTADLVCAYCGPNFQEIDLLFLYKYNLKEAVAVKNRVRYTIKLDLSKMHGLLSSSKTRDQNIRTTPGFSLDRLSPGDWHLTA